MSFEPKFETSGQLLDEYISRSWRSNAQRQRAKGADFVIGKREGVYMWNLEGNHKVIDCGVGGGVHSLGHRHPEVLATLRQALDDGRDTGLWSVPNAPYLALQDRLAELSPTDELTHSVFTLCATLSVDLASMFALRAAGEGRNKILAYQHGYHGHSGFAAMATGSNVEGVIDHYNLPQNSIKFFEEYGNLEDVAEAMTDDVAAILLEPMGYESFAFASQEFLNGIGKLCNERGILFIIDETRTGLGRSGKLWASQHYNIKPDFLITGKGLSGGLYPISAVVTTADIYETCMNQHDFAYLSSLGGNEISCLVGLKVLDIVSQPEMLEHINEVSAYLCAEFQKIGEEHHNLVGPVHTLGGIQSVSIFDLDIARQVYSNLFKFGVLCHSVCEVGVPTIKFMPPIVLNMDEADEIIVAFRKALADL